MPKMMTADISFRRDNSGVMLDTWKSLFKQRRRIHAESRAPTQCILQKAPERSASHTDPGPDLASFFQQRGQIYGLNHTSNKQQQPLTSSESRHFYDRGTPGFTSPRHQQLI
uniref:Uncharacterized protein n=1 Tax=Knipowitschia caucasica TaxID=637954 RepID=A0AAV2MD80_KNICA